MLVTSSAICSQVSYDVSTEVYPSSLQCPTPSLQGVACVRFTHRRWHQPLAPGAARS